MQAVSGRAVNVLWLVMAIDMGAMAYMWSPSGFQAPLTWLLVAYFAAQSLLWVTNRMRDVDHTHAVRGGSLSITPGGAVAMSAAEPLVCFRDLRVSMFGDDARHGVHVRRDAAAGVAMLDRRRPRCMHRGPGRRMRRPATCRMRHVEQHRSRSGQLIGSANEPRSGRPAASAPATWKSQTPRVRRTSAISWPVPAV